MRLKVFLKVLKVGRVGKLVTGRCDVYWKWGRGGGEAWFVVTVWLSWNTTSWNVTSSLGQLPNMQRQ